MNGAAQPMTNEAPPSPRWAWPFVVAIAAVAGLSYAWQASSGTLEIYYEAAVRSMGSSWHDFVYGAFDPAGTITLDKLPGAFWVQGLSVRMFGFHEWAIIAPQIAEGVLTILVLYRAVSRLAGHWAGMVAALVMAVTPATVALNRGNISDSLLILLLVLAANSTVTAIVKSDARWLALAGLWVGLAFQAKMLQAWLLLPVIALVWCMAGPGKPLRRMVEVAIAVAIAVVVSLSYITAVSLVPAGSRPYVDGSTHDSLWQMVFSYNGFGRPLASSHAHGGVANLLQDFRLPGSGLARLFSDAGGRDIGWLIPLAVIAAGVVIIGRRRQPWNDPLRVGAVLFGSWFLISAVAFCVLDGINAYYLAALTPMIGALLGIGAESLRRQGLSHRRVVGGIGGIAILTVAYGLWLLSPTGVSIRIGVGAAALLLVGGSWCFFRRSTNALIASVLIVVAVALPCAVATVNVFTSGMGPFDTPFEPSSVFFQTQIGPRNELAGLQLDMPRILSANVDDRYVSADYLAINAAGMIIESGREFEPIGGFDGTSPSPTLAQLKRQIADGQLQTIFSPMTSDPRIRWIANHCAHVPSSPRLPVYFCAQSTLSRPG
jgi:4-amino-4-deoxy-L-arabinose transferase-like glycosyltransferase